MEADSDSQPLGSKQPTELDTKLAETQAELAEAQKKLEVDDVHKRNAAFSMASQYEQSRLNMIVHSVTMNVAQRNDLDDQIDKLDEVERQRRGEADNTLGKLDAVEREKRANYEVARRVLRDQIVKSRQEMDRTLARWGESWYRQDTTKFAFKAYGLPWDE